MKAAGEPGKIRHCHTIERYQAIYDAAPAWMQNAIDLALYSLQRREDLVLLHRDNIIDNCIRVLQRKTRNYTKPIYIDIEMVGGLAETVRRCIKSDIPCPYLIHRRPKRAASRENLRGQKTRPHAFAVAPDYFSQSFRKIRDSVGVYDDLALAERSTVHEIRALGIKLYEDAGYDDKYISALSGHADGRMLSHYKRDHAAKPKRVFTGLQRADVKL